MSTAILIVGATGKQGGATLAALARAATSTARNTSTTPLLLAVTRDSTSPAAVKIASMYDSKQVRLVQGNLDEPEALFQNAEKVADGVRITGVFSVQLPTFNKTGGETEERQGKSLVDAAAKHGVEHFVYSSVDRGGPERSGSNPTNVPHFLTKNNIEKHLISSQADKRGGSGSGSGSGMTWTILRLVAFYENLGGFQGKIFATAWRDVVRPGRTLQLISTGDVGRVAAKALLNPAEFAGRAISLAGDELTFAQFDEIFRGETGKPAPTTFGFLRSLVFWMVKELSSMYAWFDGEGFGASVDESRRVLPEMLDFRMWLREQEQKTKGAKKE